MYHEYFLCVYVSMVYVWVWCTTALYALQTLGKVTRFLVHHFPPYSLKTRSLTETEAGLVTNKPCHPPVSASNSTGIIDMHSYAQLVTRVLRIQTWVFMFVQQALSPTETFSNMERCTATPVYTELGIKPRALCMLGWYSANWICLQPHCEGVYQGLRNWVVRIDSCSLARTIRS